MKFLAREGLEIAGRLTRVFAESLGAELLALPPAEDTQVVSESASAVRAFTRRTISRAFACAASILAFAAARSAAFSFRVMSRLCSLFVAL
jgi:hypothetical protein